MELKERVEGIVNEWIKGGECFLVEVKTSPSRVAVAIDKPAGVSLQECASLSRTITDTLDPEGVWESHELEVSSPGMDQPLKVYQQYLRRIGREVRVITREGREHKGKLQSANETGFELLEITSRKENKKKVETETLHRFTYDQIKETKLILSFKIK
jgi:ribosome maturation factor RimP